MQVIGHKKGMEARVLPCGTCISAKKIKNTKNTDFKDFTGAAIFKMLKVKKIH